MSVNNKFSRNREHQEVWELLPWFINHSLSAAEHTRVENHVKTCVTCRIELKQQQQVYENIQQADLLQQVSNASFKQLKKRIEVQPGGSQLATGHNKHGHFQIFSFQFPGFTKYIALAASVLLLTTTLIFNVLHEEPELRNEYRTLSRSAEPHQENQHPNLVRVIFADETDSSQIHAIVNSVSGHIINGPYKNGMYEIRIDSEQTYSKEITDTIARLRNNTNVIFAELARGSLSPD